MNETILLVLVLAVAGFAQARTITVGAGAGYDFESIGLELYRSTTKTVLKSTGAPFMKLNGNPGYHYTADRERTERNEHAKSNTQHEARFLLRFTCLDSGDYNWRCDVGIAGRGMVTDCRVEGV